MWLTYLKTKQYRTIGNYEIENPQKHQTFS